MKNVVENFVEKGVGKIRLKKSVDKFGRNDVLKICMKQKNIQLCGKNWIINFVEKFNVIFFGTIRCINFV